MAKVPENPQVLALADTPKGVLEGARVNLQDSPRPSMPASGPGETLYDGQANPAHEADVSLDKALADLVLKRLEEQRLRNAAPASAAAPAVKEKPAADGPSTGAHEAESSKGPIISLPNIPAETGSTSLKQQHYARYDIFFQC
jgi:hypothetical protein